jgi:hypothetical protein
MNGVNAACPCPNGPQSCTPTIVWKSSKPDAPAQKKPPAENSTGGLRIRYRYFLAFASASTAFVFAFALALAFILSALRTLDFASAFADLALAAFALTPAFADFFMVSDFALAFLTFEAAAFFAAPFDVLRQYALTDEPALVLYPPTQLQEALVVHLLLASPLQAFCALAGTACIANAAAPNIAATAAIFMSNSLIS